MTDTETPDKPVPTAQTFNGEPVGNPGPHKPSAWQKFRGWPTWAQVTTAIVGVILLIGIFTPAEESKKENASDKERSAKAVPITEPASEGAVTIEDSEPPAAEKKPEKPKFTSAQERAMESAQSYLDFSGFSKAGLIRQLSSPAGDGFSKADATFAVNHMKVNWNAEAVESAKSYLEMSPMSEAELIQQLTSSAGEQFTPAQARYAVRKVY